jgi:transposase-like protein
LYRAVDEGGQVIDVLLRTQRDLASAEAFFIRATARRQTVPTEVVTDKHQSYVGAVRKHASEAMHIRTGLHRASGQTTKAIKRSHLPIKERLRPMRELHSIVTGQRLLEGIEITQAIRRGELWATWATIGDRDLGIKRYPYEAARETVEIFTSLAKDLCSAA